MTGVTSSGERPSHLLFSAVGTVRAWREERQHDGICALDVDSDVAPTAANLDEGGRQTHHDRHALAARLVRKDLKGCARGGGGQVGTCNVCGDSWCVEWWDVPVVGGKWADMISRGANVSVGCVAAWPRDLRLVSLRDWLIT